MPARVRRFEELKLMVFGTAGVGTTALSDRFYLGNSGPEFLNDPPFGDTYRKQVVVDEQQCILEFIDQSWKPTGKDSARLLDCIIRGSDGILLVYGIDSPSSLDEARVIHQYILTVRASMAVSREKLPIILVRNKSDQAVEAEPTGYLPFPLPPRASRHPRSRSSLAAAVSRNEARCRLYGLPNELLYIITKYLDPASVVALCFASKRFYLSRLWDHVNGGRSLLKGLLLAEELGCGFIETSARTGLNVHTAFIELVRKVRQQKVDYYQDLKHLREEREAQQKRGSILRYNSSKRLRGRPKCPFL